jgi:hypothetical protein
VITGGQADGEEEDIKRRVRGWLKKELEAKEAIPKKELSR